MPLTYEILKTVNLTLERGSGVITAQDVMDLKAAYVADPAHCPDRPKLCDLSAVEDLDLNFEDLRALRARLVRMVPQADAGAPVAIVAPGDVAFGVARMWASILDAEGTDAVHVSRNEAEALAWLGRSEMNIRDLVAANRS